ncbi:MAG TPA: glycosyltransferase family 9 protein [Thermoanaerobaculia bacterium]|nr:glycosyltransferase family 9 protein [Thermoanaerobaculia bacterium]
MNRLLAIRLSALGDVIHAIPAVVSLRGAYEVSWVVERPYAELVQIVAGVDVIPVRLKKWSLGAVLTARDAVQDFDVAVDFQGLIKSALLGWRAAPVRYGFAGDFVREKPASWFYNRKVAIDPSRHVVDWNLQLASAVAGVGKPPQSTNWRAFPRDATGRLERFRNKIVLLPGAGRSEKLWPHFRALVERYGDRAVVVPGPGERQLAAAIGGTIAGDTDLRELAFILQNAEVVVGADTGPLHLADALGTKVVGLYGPTDPRRNGPYSQVHRTIRAATMDAIMPEAVIAKIEE